MLSRSIGRERTVLERETLQGQFWQIWVVKEAYHAVSPLTSYRRQQALQEEMEFGRSIAGEADRHSKSTIQSAIDIQLELKRIPDCRNTLHHLVARPPAVVVPTAMAVLEQRSRLQGST